MHIMIFLRKKSVVLFMGIFAFLKPMPINGFGAEAFVAEATEIIGVVRIGVNLVEYIYKVFSKIARDSGAADGIER